MDQSYLPTEILHKILYNLELRDINNCRNVCLHWRNAIDEASEHFWKKQCAKEFKDVYEDCYKKSGLNWRELGMSLSLWPDVGNSQVKYDKIPDEYFSEEKKYCLLNNHILCFPLKYSYEKTNSKSSDTMIYYDILTLKEVSRSTYGVNFDNYAENDDLIVFDYKEASKSALVLSVTVRITPKANRNKIKEVCIPLYTPWLLRDREVFYQCCNDEGEKMELHKYNVVIKDNNVEYEHSILGGDIVGDLEDVHYVENGKLNVFKTYDGSMEILQVNNNEIEHKCDVDALDEDEVIDELKSHGFNWSHRSIFFWLSCNLYDTPIASFCAPLDYSKYLIVGQKWPPQIKIFDNPYDDGKLKLENPVKVIDLEPYTVTDEELTKRVRRDSDFTHIERIDVIEIVNGHRLLVNFCWRLFIIDLVSNDGGK